MSAGEAGGDVGAFDAACPACGTEHDTLTENTLGMVCARCHRHTGNNTQGHYWGLCKVLLAEGKSWQDAVIDYHFCCPGDCDLTPATPPEGASL